MTRRAHAYKNKSRASKAQVVQEIMPAMDTGHMQRRKKEKVPCRVDISDRQCRMYYFHGSKTTAIQTNSDSHVKLLKTHIARDTQQCARLTRMIPALHAYIRCYDLQIRHNCTLLGYRCASRHTCRDYSSLHSVRQCVADWLL